MIGRVLFHKREWPLLQFIEMGSDVVVDTLLYIVDKPEMILPRDTQLCCRIIRDTQQFQGVVIKTTFNVLADDAIDLYLAIDTFKIG